MGYDAVNVGPDDLCLGSGFLKSVGSTYRLTFISTNLVDGNGQPLFRPYVVRSVGRTKVAIFGMLDRKTVSVAEPIHVADPVESIRRAMSAIKGKVDFLIVLTQQDMARDRHLAEALPSLDLILRGRSGDIPNLPVQVGKTTIFEIGNRGQRVGRIVIDRSRHDKPGWEVAEMGEKIGDDPGVRAMIEAYNSQVVRLFSLRGQAFEPLKAEACSKCHEREYAHWQETAHAKAYASLAHANREFDPGCLKCHTTRFNEPGGFSMRDQPAGLRNVQCEACHGDSSAHVDHPEKKKPVRQTEVSTCVKCHTTEQSPDFAKRYHEYYEQARCRAQR